MGSIGCDKLGSFVLVPQVSEYESMLIVHMCLLSKVLLKESQIEYCVDFICKLMVYVQHRVKVLSPPCECYPYSPFTIKVHNRAAD
jgi:hypothetical protein